MAAATEPNPPPFTFFLEYMGSAMVIKTVRPASYIMFDDQPAFGCPERNVQGPLLASPDLSILASERTIVHEEGKIAAEYPQADTKVQRSKRKYRCRVCKTDGHGKRTCKLVQPTALGGHKQISFEDIDPPLPEHPVPITTVKHG
ncbi:hypothetical protein WN943_006448 [Citrus x changshan-huyou]